MENVNYDVNTNKISKRRNQKLFRSYSFNRYTDMVALFGKILTEVVTIDEDYEQVIQNFNHLTFFKKMDKLLFEKIKLHMHLYKFEKNEVICSKYQEMGRNTIDEKPLNFIDQAIILLQGKFRLSNDHKLEKSFSINRKIIKISENIIDNEVYSQIAYPMDMVRDIRDDNNDTFQELIYNCVYAITNNSWVLIININECEKIFNEKNTNLKNKNLKEFLKSVFPKSNAFSLMKFSKVMDLFKEKKFNAGEYMCKESENQEFVYLIFTGKVQLISKIKFNLKNGKNRNPINNLVHNEVDSNIVVYETRQWINEDCVCLNIPSKFSVKCLMDTTVYQIFHKDFTEKLINFSDLFLRYIYESIKHKKKLYSDRISSIHSRIKKGCNDNYSSFHNNKVIFDEIKYGFPTSFFKFFQPSHKKFVSTFNTPQINKKLQHNPKSLTSCKSNRNVINQNSIKTKSPPNSLRMISNDLNNKTHRSYGNDGICALLNNINNSNQEVENFNSNPLNRTEYKLEKSKSSEKVLKDEDHNHITSRRKKVKSESMDYYNSDFNKILYKIERKTPLKNVKFGSIDYDSDLHKIDNNTHNKSTIKNLNNFSIKEKNSLNQLPKLNIKALKLKTHVKPAVKINNISQKLNMLNL